tara:strand:+ start:239 stop:721 length:483 start_codon:yes stop_codon:yes gene_type:complete
MERLLLTSPGMTEGNSSVLYLDSEDYRKIPTLLAEWVHEHDEPIPSFKLAKHGDLESLVQIPRAHFFGMEAYPTLAEKAAIIFYSINKRQMFLNGNKRMSTLSLLVFLGINNKMLDSTPDELTDKAMWLAKTSSLDFPEVKGELVHWINAHMVDIPDGAL